MKKYSRVLIFILVISIMLRGLRQVLKAAPQKTQNVTGMDLNLGSKSVLYHTLIT